MLDRYVEPIALMYLETIVEDIFLLSMQNIQKHTRFFNIFI